MSQLHCYKRSDNKWAWRLTADNGAIVATDGGQGYNNYSDCQAMADAVVVNATFATATRTRQPG